MPLILPVNNVPVITTTSLPDGTQNVAYGPVQLTATGGTPPYLWSAQQLPLGMAFSSTGVLSGTPANGGTFNINFQVVDSLGIPSFQLALPVNIVANARSGLGPPTLWPAWTKSDSLGFAWWPPTTGPADSYNVYRSDVNGGLTPMATGILETRYPPQFPTINYTQLWFWDWNGQVINGVTYNLTPGTTYQYWVTAVTGGVESAPSPKYTVTTRSNSPGTVLPTAPTDPSAYYTDAPTSYGGTVWTCTILNDTSYAGTAGSGTLHNVGCSAQYAFTNAAPGDTIVLTAGATYNSTQSNQGAFVINASGTQAQPINVISSQDPVFLNGGTLPPYQAYVSGKTRYATLALTASPAVGATSATLTANWTARSQYIPVVFRTSEASSMEHRVCHFVKNSSTVTWNTGLIGTGAEAKLYVANNIPFVTPDDSASMPWLQFFANGQTPTNNGGNGLTINGSFIRLVGINVSPAPATPSNKIGFACITINGGNVVLDRCIAGSDTTITATWSQCLRAVVNNGVNVGINQCYLYGASGGYNPPYGSTNSTDSQAVYFARGGPLLIQSCFLEASSENIFCGGGYFPRAVAPHDLTARGNYLQKNGAWDKTAIGAGVLFGRYVKNLTEFKIMSRAHIYDNIFQNNWSGQATGGQKGRCFNLGPIDQVAEAGQSRTMASGPTWNNGVASASFQFENLSESAIGDIVRLTVQNTVPAGWNGTFLATWQGVDGSGTGHFTYPLAVNPGPATTLGSMVQVMQGTQPWNIVQDINIHDNLIYNTDTAFYAHSDDGHQSGGYAARFWFHNNTIWINPACTDDTNQVNDGWGWSTAPRVTDVTVDHNTFITIPNKTGFLSTATSAQNVSFEGFSDTPFSNMPQIMDHMTITNNIFDGVGFISVTSGGSHGGFTGSGQAAINGWWNPNTVTFQGNVMAQDSTNYPPLPAGGTANYNLSGVYTSMISGFAGNTVFPPNPQAWNVNVAPYTTGATDGGPVGAKF